MGVEKSMYGINFVQHSRSSLTVTYKLILCL